MRKEYDFSKARRNPYAGRFKRQVTIRLDANQAPPARAPRLSRALGRAKSGVAKGMKTRDKGKRMRNEFTAVIERDGSWYIAYCPEIPGANGQGRTKAEARRSLVDAIALILEDRRKDGLRGVPRNAVREKVVVG